MKTFAFGVLFSIFWVITLTSCKNMSANFIVYKKGEVVPILVLPTKPKGIETKAATLFIEKFKSITGTSIKTIAESAYKKTDKQVAIFLGNTLLSKTVKAEYTINDDGFTIGQDENNVFITYKQGLGLLYGVSTFFEDYAQSYYIDQNELITPQLDLIQLPSSEITPHTPAFKYRQAYFPQSQDYNYTTWNKIHLIEEHWAVWGHHLDKLINFGSISADQKNQIFALVNGKRTDEQYCFSSSTLQNELIKGIELKKSQNPDATYYSIAPNDNSLVCGCEKCLSINKNTTSSSNTVAQLLNTLSKRFPDLVFTTHAYLSTIKPPTGLKLNNNIIVLLSTIDFPKGQPLSQSKKANEFRTLVDNWKNVCQELYVWDYTVQYTNYFELFPNLSALQQDLQFFKQLGITGVLEQGSEDQYSLYCDWKSYAIAKLLWNPELDMDKLRYAFFEQAYPTHVDFITDYLWQLEDNMKKSGKNLNIYGTVQESLKSYLNQEQFDLFYYDFMEKYVDASGPELKRLQGVITSLIYTKLEIARSSGVSAYGYAQLLAGDSIQINTEIAPLLSKLNELSLKSGARLSNEVGDSVSSYIAKWNKYIINRTLKSKIIEKPITILTKSNGEFQGNAAKALNDASFGFTDFEVNWLVFNTKTMDVEIPVSSFKSAQTISMSFLNDPRHVIYAPEKVEVYTVSSNGTKTKLTEKPTPKPNTPQKDIVEFKLALPTLTSDVQKLVIVAVGISSLPEWASSTNRKPSIACDEIQLY